MNITSQIFIKLLKMCTIATISNVNSCKMKRLLKYYIISLPLVFIFCFNYSYISIKYRIYQKKNALLFVQRILTKVRFTDVGLRVFWGTGARVCGLMLKAIAQCTDSHNHSHNHRCPF